MDVPPDGTAVQVEAARSMLNASPAEARPAVVEARPVGGRRRTSGWQNRLTKWLSGWLIFFAGAPAVDLREPRWFERLIVFVLLLLALAVLGWQTLYITNGANFGVGGFLNYFALFLWGFSADVVGRTITSLSTAPR